MEGWPPPFPDAIVVHGEEENIGHGLWAMAANATDEPKLTNGTDGLKYVPKYVPNYRLGGQPVVAARGVAGHGACPCLMVARVGCRG